jgi:hypothetical protein
MKSTSIAVSTLLLIWAVWFSSVVYAGPPTDQKDAFAEIDGVEAPIKESDVLLAPSESIDGVCLFPALKVGVRVGSDVGYSDVRLDIGDDCSVTVGEILFESESRTPDLDAPGTHHKTVKPSKSPSEDSRFPGSSLTFLGPNLPQATITERRSWANSVFRDFIHLTVLELMAKLTMMMMGVR